MGGMGGMGGGGNQHFSHMGGGGNQNFSHMGGGGPASPQWKTTLCKNYQEDGRFVRVIYAVLAMRTHIWDLVSTGTWLLKRSQKVPIIAHKTQISVAPCFRIREDIKYVTFYPFHKFLKCIRCEFGARCQFAHGQLELRTLAQNYLQLNPQVPFINM